ncbi:hypothetical protein [Actinomadura rugatobispora]|uniref:Uncharacterized protein n=1 Tax=Actinomadura rugatobispora TaxID=1994 RepID=A0ABW1AAP7_9ACTN
MAGVLILNWTVCPTFTLNEVVKPSIVWPPPDAFSHSEGGEPGFEFSHATGLPPASHGPAAARTAGVASAARHPATRANTISRLARTRMGAAFMTIVPSLRAP